MEEEEKWTKLLKSDKINLYISAFGEVERDSFFFFIKVEEHKLNYETFHNPANSKI